MSNRYWYKITEWVFLLGKVGTLKKEDLRLENHIHLFRDHLPDQDLLTGFRIDFEENENHYIYIAGLSLLSQSDKEDDVNFSLLNHLFLPFMKKRAVKNWRKFLVNNKDPFSSYLIFFPKIKRMRIKT